MSVAVEREPAAVSGARELGLPEPSVRSIFKAGAPRFAREMFGPVLGFYVAWKLGGLAAGIVTATVVALGIEWYERRHGRRGSLALLSAAFVVLQGVVGLVADSAVVYLAQPVLVSAIWGIANLVSVAIGRPLMGVFADAWYPFPDFVKASRTYRRIFGFESVIWGLYLLARSGVRMLVLWTGSIGLFVAIQFVTAIPFIIGLVLWSLWYAVRGFARTTEWDDAEVHPATTSTAADRSSWSADEAGATRDAR
jgi:MFS family permease